MEEEEEEEEEEAVLRTSEYMWLVFYLRFIQHLYSFCISIPYEGNLPVNNIWPTSTTTHSTV
jgi:hypothetical protein